MYNHLPRKEYLSTENDDSDDTDQYDELTPDCLFVNL